MISPHFPAVDLENLCIVLTVYGEYDRGVRTLLAVKVFANIFERWN